MDNPLKWNPSHIRSALLDLGEKLNGLDLDDAVLKFYEKIKGERQSFTNSISRKYKTSETSAITFY